MGNLNLTTAERQFVERAALKRGSTRSLAAFYVCTLAPMLAFAAYGLVRRDAIAEFVAFAGVFLVMVWRISHEVVAIGLYESALRKIVEHERAAPHG